MGKKIMNHRDLQVYQKAFQAAMTIFELSKSFPAEERFSLTDQIRRSSRSICAQIAEGWRRRRYVAAFVNKMNEAEGEVAETQTWLEFSVHCGYMQTTPGRELYRAYNSILRTLVGIINHPQTWVIGPAK